MVQVRHLSLALGWFQALDKNTCAYREWPPVLEPAVMWMVAHGVVTVGVTTPLLYSLNGIIRED